jgi:hypothetical protein
MAEDKPRLFSRGVGKYAGMGIAVLLCFAGFLIYAIQQIPFTYSEMDLNRDGWVNLGEFDYCLDYGMRTTMIRGHPHTEFYALKDGLTIKAVPLKSNPPLQPIPPPGG